MGALLGGLVLLTLLTIKATFLIYVGVALGIALTVIGLAITIPVLWRWISSTRSDIEELPPGH